MAEAGSPISGFGTVRDLPDLPPDFADRFTSRQYDVGEIALHAVTGGAGPAVLLVGGWPQFWWQWRKVMPALAEHFFVVAVDPRGVGRSDMPDHGYDSRTAAADLAALMTILGYDRFHVVGHDVGMMLAYALAADHRRRVDRLVLAEAALPGISAAPSVMPKEYREVESMWHYMFNRLTGVNERLVQGREDVYFGDQFSVKRASAATFPQQYVDVYVRALRRPGALRASFRYYQDLESLMAQNIARSVQPLAVPVLAVGGETSKGSGVAADVRRIANDVTPLCIPGCGHYVAEEAPETFATAVLDFFAAPAKS